MYENPTALAALPTDIRDYLQRYRTKQLTAEQAAATLPALRQLVAAVPPTSATNAKMLISAACTYLADVADQGTCDLSALTEAGVAGWAARQQRKGMSRGYLSAQLVHLRALLRVMAGVPGRATRRHAGPGDSGPQHQAPAPYTAEEVQVLIEAARGAGPGACAALVTVLGSGLPSGAGNATAVTTVEGELACRGPEGTLVRVTPRIAALLEGYDLGPVGEDDWASARQAADEAGTTLTYARALSTWRLAVLSEGNPLGATLKRSGIGEKGLDATAPYMPAVEAGTLARHLRG